LGLSLGVVGNISHLTVFSTVAAVATVAGDLWIAALRVVAFPLVLLLMLAAICSAKGRSVAVLGVRALLLFVAALVLFGLLALFVTPLLGSFYSPDPETIASMKTGIAIPEAAANARTISIGGWIGGLVPRNIFEAAMRGDVFALLIFTIVFGLALNRLPTEQSSPLTKAIEALSQTMLVIVHWLLVVTPFGVLAVSYVVALKTGVSLVGMLGAYLLIQPAVVLTCMIPLYVLTALLGRIPLGRFARAVLPAQIVALSTRSSIAALPALVEGSRMHLDLSSAGRDFLLPLSVSVFRISEVISNSVKLVFLAHVYGLTLPPTAIAVFLITVIGFSFSGTGTPNSGGSGGFRMVPVFVATGIPLEGVIMLEAVQTIPDIFDTVANVTGQMSATTILSRRRAKSEGPASMDASQPVIQIVIPQTEQ